jgi:ribosomal protein S25
VSDFLDEKRREITDRLKELKPLVDEFNRLEAAATALAGAVGSAASDAGGAVVRHRGRRRRRGSGRHRAAARATTPGEPEASAARTEPAKARAPKAKAARKPTARPAKRRAGRPKGSGTRAAEALTLVQGQAGITIPELATKMGINQNYLYRVLPGLQKEGKVRKQGRGWHAKGD